MLVVVQGVIVVVQGVIVAAYVVRSVVAGFVNAFAGVGAVEVDCSGRRRISLAHDALSVSRRRWSRAVRARYYLIMLAVHKELTTA